MSTFKTEELVPSYRVALTSSAAKELRELSGQLIARIVPRLENLASNPRPPGCKKLQGGDREWRIRVGDYRVVYTIDDATLLVDVTRIRHRREVYER
jgi:mRNA interferase RelE/StbE